MEIFLIIILLIVVFVVLGSYFVYRRNQTSQINQAQSEKLIHGLEAELQTVNAELGKNVKALKDLRESKQFEDYASRIVSQLNQGIIYIDKDRVIQLVNSYAEQFLDVSPVGKPYQQVLHIQLNGKSEYSLFEAAFTGKTYVLPYNYELVSQHGKIPISGTIIPLRIDNTSVTIVFIFTDDSQNIGRIKDEKAFFSTAVHELRTPLTVIHLTVGFLLKQFDTFGREKIMEHLNRIDESAERLGKLVNDYLNVSRIDQGRIEVINKPFDIVALTDEVIKDLSLLAKERKLFIHHEPVDKEHRIVIGDPSKSKEVLINLISNAIKYTIQGGLTISHQATATALLTKVTDTGNGIPDEYQGILFKRFTQLDNARLQSTAKGSGLGLYISKKFALLMHGDVYLETSEPGKGSTFTFTLPVG